MEILVLELDKNRGYYLLYGLIPFLCLNWVTELFEIPKRNPPSKLYVEVSGTRKNGFFKVTASRCFFAGSYVRVFGKEYEVYPDLYNRILLKYNKTAYFRISYDYEV